MTPPSANTPVEIRYTAWSESTNPLTIMLGWYVAAALASFPTQAQTNVLPFDVRGSSGSNPKEEGLPAPTHADAMLFMEYYKLWDTPLDGEAWTLFRSLHEQGVLDDFQRFSERVPRSSHEYVLFDRVCCSFEQAGVLMKHGLMHPDLYFDAWANPTRAWERARIPVQGLRDQLRTDELYANFEWLAGRGEQWYAARVTL